MKLNYPAIETIGLSEFIMSDTSAQCKILKQSGILVDNYAADDSLVKVYYLSGFFVEAIVSRPELENIEIIPYINGYKVEHYKDILFKTYNLPLLEVA